MTTKTLQSIALLGGWGVETNVQVSGSRKVVDDLTLVYGGVGVEKMTTEPSAFNPVYGVRSG